MQVKRISKIIKIIHFGLISQLVRDYADLKIILLHHKFVCSFSITYVDIIQNYVFLTIGNILYSLYLLTLSHTIEYLLNLAIIIQII